MNAQQEKREFPSFSTLWGHYPHSTQNPDGSWNHAHPSVDNYANQCAIRVSFTLILSGEDLDTYQEINRTTDGYARSAKNLADWMWTTYGKPEILTQEEFHKKHLNSTGIIYEAPLGPGYAPHIDLWNQGSTGSGYYESPQIWFWKIN